MCFHNYIESISISARSFPPSSTGLSRRVPARRTLGDPVGMPAEIGIVDTMIGFPHRDMKEAYRFITRQTKDAESKEQFAFPVEYMFKDVPEDSRASDDPIGVTLREMDLWGIERGMIGVGDAEGLGVKALAQHPDRFIASSSADPNEGMEGIAPARAGVRDLRHPRRERLPGRDLPAGADQRQEDVPPLRQVRRARHPDLLLRRRPRAA